MKLYHLLYLCLVLAAVIIIFPSPFQSGFETAAVSTFTLAGDSLARMEKDTLAVSSYSYALGFDENNTEILQKKGDCLFREGDYLAAAEVFTIASLLEPENPAYPLGRGRALLMAGDSEGAEECFNEAVSRAPADPAALRTRAASLLSQGRYAEAIADLDTLVESNPESAEFRMYRGDAYMYITMTHDAEMRSMQGADQIMRSGGEHARLASDAYQKASQDYMKAMELNPLLTPAVATRMMAQAQSQVETFGMILSSL